MDPFDPNAELHELLNRIAAATVFTSDVCLVLNQLEYLLYKLGHLELAQTVGYWADGAEMGMEL